MAGKVFPYIVLVRVVNVGGILRIVADDSDLNSSGSEAMGVGSDN
jgi:hypothetical protein